MHVNPILVVYDNAQIVDILSQYIKKEGWPMLAAKTGEEALALFDAAEPSLEFAFATSAKSAPPSISAFSAFALSRGAWVRSGQTIAEPSALATPKKRLRMVGTP